MFTRKRYRDIIVESLQFCQKEKGMTVYGYVIMSNHLHMILQSDKNDLSGLIRDFKMHTSKKILSAIKTEPESRREWLLPLLHKYCEHLKREQQHKLWQDGNHAKVIYTNEFFYEKLNYIHQNPVQDMLVQEPQDYLFSSARNYAELPSLLDIILETTQLKTYV